jgi:hypothetical protein
MRLPVEVGQKLDSETPLRLVNRGAQASGRLSAHPPSKTQTLDYWKTLTTYLDTLPSVLDELGIIAEKVAKKNTISKWWWFAAATLLKTVNCLRFLSTAFSCNGL